MTKIVKVGMFLARRRRTFGVSGPPQTNFWRFWPAAGEIMSFVARRRRNFGVSGPPQANFWRFWPAAGELLAFLVQNRVGHSKKFVGHVGLVGHQGRLCPRDATSHVCIVAPSGRTVVWCVKLGCAKPGRHITKKLNHA